MAIQQQPIPFIGQWPARAQFVNEDGTLTPDAAKWFTQLTRVITGIWQPVTFADQQFFAQLGTITVNEADVTMMRTFQLGPFAVIVFAFTASISADTAIIGFNVPTLIVADAVPAVGGYENRGWAQETGGVNPPFGTIISVEKVPVLSGTTDAVSVLIEKLDATDFVAADGPIVTAGMVIVEVQSFIQVP